MKAFSMSLKVPAMLLCLVILLALSVPCADAAMSTQHGHFSHITRDSGIKIMTANNVLVEPTITTREQDLEEVATSGVDWNLHLLKDAPHHSILVQDTDRVYTMHWYETEMGNVTMGDILITNEFIDYLVTHDGHTPPTVDLMGVASSRNNERWPCPIPWTSSLGNDRRITEAIQHLEEFTNWRFVQRTTESTWLNFQNSGGCSSFIGRVQNGAQMVSLANGCETAAAVHEIMHAIGIYHEQSRSDRDQFVSINTAVIQQGAANNFDLARNAIDIGSYDFGSIMHYGVRDFSANGQDVIIPRSAVPDTACYQIGQRVSVSETDVETLFYRYDGGGSCSADRDPPPFTPCLQQGSMQVCGGDNSWNGVYIPDATINGFTSYIRYPWTQSDRFIYYASNRGAWCLSTSTNGGCSRTASSGGGDRPDEVSWPSPTSVSLCDGAAPPNPCTNNPCQNGGMCNNQGNGDFTCSCPNEWTGDTCQTSDNDCSPNPCLNGGICSDTGLNQFNCQCVNGFEGDTCQTAPDPCETRPCQNGGVCTATGATTFTCDCVGEWEGDICDESTNSCFNMPCLNGGTCTSLSDGNFQCMCPNEYRGGRCEIADDDCSPDPCLNGGVCEDIGIQLFECDCPPEFLGDRCETELEPCTGNPCLNGGTCVTMGDLATCVCEDEWRGDLCEIPDDDCAPNPCQNGGACRDTGEGEFVCSCADGWQGDTCTESTDDCSPNPCANGGRCIDGDSSFTCECAAGFEGDVCQINIDDCPLNLCANGECVDAVNSYLCDCDIGWFGDLCNTAINGCDPDPCANGANCIQNNPGGPVQCECPEGLTGNLCNIDISDCAPNPCQNNGICSDTGILSYECTCVPGFLGILCEFDADGQISPTTAITATDNPRAGSESDETGGIGGGGNGPLIGGAVGAILIIILIVAVVVIYRRKKAKTRYSTHQTHMHGAMEMPNNPDEDVVELSMSDGGPPQVPPPVTSGAYAAPPRPPPPHSQMLTPPPAPGRRPPPRGPRGPPPRTYGAPPANHWV